MYYFTESSLEFGKILFLFLFKDLFENHGYRVPSISSLPKWLQQWDQSQGPGSSDLSRELDQKWVGQLGVKSAATSQCWPKILLLNEQFCLSLGDCRDSTFSDSKVTWETQRRQCRQHSLAIAGSFQQDVHSSVLTCHCLCDLDWMRSQRPFIDCWNFLV